MLLVLILSLFALTAHAAALAGRQAGRSSAKIFRRFITTTNEVFR
jgi:hypothetical protein